MSVPSLRNIAFKNYEQTITVATRTEIGKDSHNNPIYT